MAWEIDPSHTLVAFAAKHMMIASVRGRFTRFSGSLDIDEAHPEKSSVDGTIELASIDTGDPKRDAHLRSADFFDVAQYPTMTFKSKRVEVVSSDHARVTGDLAIKGTSHEVVFDVTSEGRAKDPWGGDRWGFSVRDQLNRKDWGLNWNVALEAGGWLVGNEIKIEMEVEAVRKVEQPAGELVAATA